MNNRDNFLTVEWLFIAHFRSFSSAARHDALHGAQRTRHDFFVFFCGFLTFSIQQQYYIIITSSPAVAASATSAKRALKRVIMVKE